MILLVVFGTSSAKERIFIIFLFLPAFARFFVLFRRIFRFRFFVVRLFILFFRRRGAGGFSGCFFSWLGLFILGLRLGGSLCYRGLRFRNNGGRIGDLRAGADGISEYNNTGS